MHPTPLRSEPRGSDDPSPTRPISCTPWVTPPDDAALIRRLCQGEDAAFEELVRDHGARMLATARRLVRQPADAPAVVEAAFGRAFEQLDAGSVSAPLREWLNELTARAAVERIPCASRADAPSIEALLPRFLPDGHRARPEPAWTTSPEALLGRGDGRRLVRSLIDRLPDDHRIVLLLRDVEGLDTTATASILGLPATLVRTRLHRARLALRELLAPSMA